MVTQAAQKKSSPSNEAQFHPLMVASVQGDAQQYQKLLEKIMALAGNYVRKKLGAHEAHDELVQEILLSVHKSLHTYDPKRPCMPWIAAIMHYRLSDWLRAHYRTNERPMLPLEEVEFFLQSPVTKDSFEYEYMHKALAQLPEKQQRVIQLMYFDELTTREASQKLDMSVSAVKVTAHRAYKKLRAIMEEM